MRLNSCLMSRAVKLVLVFACLAAIAGLAARLPRFLARDVFAGFRKADLGDIGIQLKDVQLSHYDKGKLVGTAHANTVNVRQDRQFFDFLNVSRGKVGTSKGPMAFSANSATFDSLTHELNVAQGAKVANKNLNLTAPAFTYNQAVSTLTMPGRLEGTFFGGRLSATHLTYNSSNDSYKVFNVKWQGTLPKEAVVSLPQAGSTRTRWMVEGDEMSQAPHSSIQVFTNARASDGEILVKAPHVELDRHTDVLTATGQVFYFSAKANLVCDKAVVYRREKRAVLTGNVHMLVKPKDEESIDMQEVPPWQPPVPTAIAKSRPAAPETAESQQQKDLEDDLRSDKTVRKYPAHIHAEQVEYWYAKGSRHAVITGSPEAYQEFPQGEWRRITTYKALYDGEKDELTVESRPNKDDTRMVNSLGDDLIADLFRVSTSEDSDVSDYYGKHVRGAVMTNDEQVPSGKTTKPEAPTPLSAPVTSSTGGKGGK